MSPFELAEPASLAEALALLDPEDSSVRAIAGGTALMLMMKSGLYRPRRLVSLRKLGPALAGIRIAADGGLEIGAMVPLAELQRSAAVREAAPVIAETLLTHSNVRVRNVATIGGNLAHGDPHMDLPPVLIALGAAVRVAGPDGERTIAVEDLFTGYLETVLANDELITAVSVPPQASRQAAYVKCTARSADDWPALGLAVSLRVEDGIVEEPRIAIGAATEVAMRLSATEAWLTGRRIDDAALRDAGRAAAAEAPVVADHHGSAAYKRVLVEVYLGRALRRALAGPTPGAMP
jgi:carbon-monoxide dehydrogenase medium subunit